MKVCSRLESGINFDMQSINPCCPGTKYTLPFIPYAGVDFPVDAFLNMREKTRSEIEVGSSPCLVCPFLTDLPNPPPRSPYMIDNIVLNHFRHCNCKCYYCDAWWPANEEKNKQRYSVLPALTFLIQNRHVDPAGLVEWGGGEPTILPEFEELMNLLTSYGIKNIINTNAIHYSSALSNAMTFGNAFIQVSLDSGTPETYHKVKGQPIFEDVCSNIKRYADSAPERVTLKYIMSARNSTRQDINGFLDLASQSKISNIVLSPEAAEAWSHKINDATADSIRLFKEEAAARGMKLGILSGLFGKEYEALCTATGSNGDDGTLKKSLIPARLQRIVKKIYASFRS